MPSVDDLIVIKERVEAELLSRPGVTAVDVGYKEVGGQRTGQLAIRVHVAAKTDNIPADQHVPAEIEGAVTDVLERRYELHVAPPQLAPVSPEVDTGHYTPLAGGISIGPSREIDGFIFAGTLGAVVIDNTTNARAALTNFHVAAVDTTFHNGDRMVQPSQIDGGEVPDDEFGALVREILSADVDGAVISIDPTRSTDCGVVGRGPVRGRTAAAMNMRVHKRGRTTGLTHGSVDGVAMSVPIDYGDGIGIRTLVNQVSVVPDTSQNQMFSDHGDSGSLIVDDSGFAVGLLFAGSAV
jgi:hypothetical protein